MEEIKKIDPSNVYDIYYYDFMLKMALEDLEFELRR